MSATPKTVSRKTFIIAVVLLALLNIGQWWYRQHRINAFRASANSQKIAAIERYLDGIGADYTAQVKSMAEQTKLPSWGCGPSSYALAQLLDKKFFGGKLVIGALYDNEPYEIIERFGFVQYPDNGNTSIGDHAWIEIYLGGRVMFIDPTVAQYGRSQGIAYEVLRVGDPGYKDLLKNKYGIIDDRISLLVRKYENKIPVDQLPYPGMALDPRYADYYKLVVKDRDTVALGYEPDGWKGWVDSLLSVFAKS